MVAFMLEVHPFRIVRRLIRGTATVNVLQNPETVKKNKISALQTEMNALHSM